MEPKYILYLSLYFSNFLLIGIQATLTEEEIAEVATLTVPEFIAKYKYPIEIHHIETEDGYILELHRIPYGINSTTKQAPKPVVFLQHGLFASSVGYVIFGPTKGLGMLLADLGYDVWMGNARGNKYSRNHTSLDPKTREFWDFSWHEIGMYDLPAMIDYVLNYTKQEKIFYIGYSQGTTNYFVMASERPEYNDKIKLMIALAPIAYMSHTENKYLKAISTLDAAGKGVLNVIGDFEFLPNMKILYQFGNVACSPDAVTQIVCKYSLFQTVGYNEEQMEPYLFPLIMGHMPAGCSTKQILHYAHQIHSGKFQQYNYGMMQNYVKYNSATPPNYDLSKISAPVALIYSTNDLIAVPVDVQQLYEELGNPVEKILVSDPLFSHLDYVFGKDAVALVYDDVFRLMKKYE